MDTALDKEAISNHSPFVHHADDIVRIPVQVPVTGNVDNDILMGSEDASCTTAKINEEDRERELSPQALLVRKPTITIAGKPDNCRLQYSTRRPPEGSHVLTH